MAFGELAGSLGLVASAPGAYAVAVRQVEPFPGFTTRGAVGRA